MVSSGKKNYINILSVKKMMIIKSNYYTKCFQKRVLMQKVMMEKLNGCIFIEDDEKLETYNNIWNRANNCIKKELDCELICKTTFRETKIRLTVTRLQISTIKKYLR